LIRVLALTTCIPIGYRRTFQAGWASTVKDALASVPTHTRAAVFARSVKLRRAKIIASAGVAELGASVARAENWIATFAIGILLVARAADSTVA
jgi:hypothetical protein